MHKSTEASALSISPEAELQLSEAALRSIFSIMAEGLVVQQSDGRIIDANPAAEEILGLSRDEMLGRASIDPRWRSIHEDGTPFPGESHPAMVTLRTGQALRNQIMGVEDPRRGLRWISINSTPISGHTAGSTDAAVATTFTDITERRQLEDQVVQLALHDPLTGLPNRRLLDDHVRQAMASGGPGGARSALLLIDLDDFKVVNDRFGHEVGDQLLIEVAQRMRACIRAGETVARFGGDEFVVVVGDLEGDQAATMRCSGAVAERIRHALSQPYQLDIAVDAGGRVEHRSTASIGVALFGGEPSPPAEVLKLADAAMYVAKRGGGNRVCFSESTA
jgi:diguanylate cyclase (GGDEF)-like protein/PAS domain S-box-containing protein